MNQFDYIFWDFDGTLFDSYPFLVNAFHKALLEEGREESVEEIEKAMKISVSFAVEHFHLKQREIDLFFKNKSTIKKENMQPFEYIPEILNKIVGHNGKNYIYTHRSKSTIDYLQFYQLDELFTDFIIKEDQFKRKPDPEALNYMIHKHQLHKEKCLMIGDREIDVLAAKNAGIYSCLYDPNKNITYTVADFIISSFEELNTIIFK